VVLVGQKMSTKFPKTGAKGLRDEYLQILKKIWTDDVVEFKGQFYNIPASKIGPKPIQKPHIPIYLGGYSQSWYSYDIAMGSFFSSC
jgi:alkanesulfonate monooxygenase SsuD/methylene tetrahydromethanopterin reductase-like flavin-dependent oxidoreductase (luciferase family)